MQHHTSLIATVVAALCLSFVFGAAAQRAKLSPLVGYLVAGVVIGPFTPGFVADQQLVPQLAEIGVILLMFGVGLHFSLKDLLAVRVIALPGALGQIAFVTLLGTGLATLLSWPIGGGIVFGLCLSVASTVVVLRALQERRLLQTERGRIAVGWLIVEDLAMVLALVLLPALSGILGGDATGQPAAGGLVAWLEPSTVWAALGLTLLKVAAFVAIMLVFGRRIIPGILHYTAHTGSRELFRLSVLAIALGVAFGAAELFGVSFALGAFFAGMILAESTLSQQAANETLPLRDAFAVLFFVSVGMLFDPTILARQPLAVIATFLIITLGNGLIGFAIVSLFRYPMRIALTLAVSLAQIGEFSFILSGLGVELKLLPPVGRDYILAGALLSIVINPLLFVGLDRLGPWIKAYDSRHEPPAAPVTAAAEPAKAAPAPKKPAPEELEPTKLSGHAVLVGYGRVGSLVGEDLIARNVPLLVIEERRQVVEDLKKRGVEVILGNAMQDGLLKAANIAGARWLISAIPNPFENANLVEEGHKTNAKLEIIARAHSDEEVIYLKKYGANFIIVGETEIARGMSEHIEGRLADDPAAVTG